MLRRLAFRSLLLAGLSSVAASSHAAPVSTRADLADGPDGKSIPAAQAPASQGLALGVTASPHERGRSFKLSIAKGGALWLSLLPDRRSSAEREFGTCELAADTASEAQQAMSSVSAWLETTPPMVPQQSAFVPVCSYVRVGAQSGREVFKLTLARANETAEVFFRLEGAAQGDLLEKSTRHRAALVRLLASTLEHRSGGKDAPKPWVAELHKLPGAPDSVESGAWAGKTWVAPSIDHERHLGEVLAWPDLSRPPRRLLSKSNVQHLAIFGDRLGKQLAVLVAYVKKPYSPVPDDAAELLLIDLASSSVRTVARTTKTEWLAHGVAALSPDSRKLAMTFHTPENGVPLGLSHGRIYDVQTLKKEQETAPTLDVHPIGWDDEGVVLMDVRALQKGAAVWKLHWKPESPACTPFPQGCSSGCRSPDGRFQLRLTEGGIETVSPPPVRSFIPDPAFKSALEQLKKETVWYGPHHLGLHADDYATWVLDLETLAFRPLLHVTLGLMAVRSDLGAFVAQSPHDGWVWGTLPP